MPRFSAVWQRFLSLPQVTAVSAAADDPVLEAWRRGRERYWVWALALEDEALQRHWQWCRETLAAWLLPDYRRQPHITLAVAGFPRGEAAPVGNDSFTPAQLAGCTERLQRARIAPFELQLGGVNSFAAAPFLEVLDPQRQLPLLRRQLRLHGGDFREAPWSPHLTLGYYRSGWRPDQLLPHLARCRPAAGLTLRVREVVVLSYAAADIAGPLTVERRVALTG